MSVRRALDRPNGRGLRFEGVDLLLLPGDLGLEPVDLLLQRLDVAARATAPGGERAREHQRRSQPSHAGNLGSSLIASRSPSDCANCRKSGSAAIAAP